VHVSTPATSPDDAAPPFAAWLIPLGIALFAAFYWNLQLAQLERAPIEIPDAMRARFGRVAAFSTAARLLMAGIETGFYALWWSAWGRRLPFLRAFFWLLVVSSLDLVAGNLRLIALERGSPWSEWIAVLAGASALHRGVTPEHRGLWLAFGSCGLLTLLRILAAARVQASLTGLRFAPVLGALAAFWTATRLITWWSVDLLSGRSALP